MAKAQTSDIERRWEGRPLTAALVRGVAFLTPVAASTVFAFIVTATLPPPSSRSSQVIMWLIVSVASTGVLILVDGLARRLLPLAALLSLSMVFPDRAPSRFKVARRVGGQRNLEARLAEARRMGEEDTAPAKAAETIIELVTALQRHDRRTRGHAERVHLFTEMLAQEMKLPDDDRDRLRWAALVHDIGKLAVPGEVLNKPGRPEPDEWEVLRRHPVEGGRLCAPLREWMGRWWLAIEQHHERYDGGGYPHGLAGKDISLGARIVSVADSFEVMTAARSYKQPSSAAAAREELARCAGTQFDPDIVRAFLNISLGRMRLALGPLSWLAQVPFFEHAIRLGGLVQLLGGLIAAAATAIVIGAPSVASQAGDDAPTEAVTTTPSEQATEPLGTVTQTVDDPLARVAPLPGTSAPSSPFTTPAILDDPQTGSGSGVTLPAQEPATPPPSDPIDTPPPGASSPQPPPGQTPAPTASPTPAPTPSPSPTPTPSPTPSPTPTPTPTPGPSPTPPAPNAAPAANDDTATTAEDTPVTVDVLGNDTDPDGDTLTLQSVSNPANGTAVDNGDGTITYTPDPDTNGTDTFGYTLSDGTTTDTATVTTNVTAVNDPPAFRSGGDQVAAEDAGPQTVPAWASDITPGPTDESGQALTFTATPDLPALFAVAPAIDPATGDLTYTPAADAHGMTTVTVTLTDDGGTANGGTDTATATFDITITAVNDPPTAVDDTATTAEDTPVTVDVLGNDTDPDGDALAVQSYDATGITDGTLTHDGGGQFTFTPDANYHGTQTFDYVARDPSGATSSARVTFTITAQPDDPVAVNDSYTMQSGTTLNVPAPGVLGNDSDADGDTLTVTDNTPPSDGVVAMNGDGSFAYTSATVGSHTFTYTVGDGTGRFATATVTIDVQSDGDGDG